jgi:hypothetical protein
MANKKHINEGMSEQTRLALLEQSIGHINETLRDIKSELKSQGNALNTKMDSHFRWTIGLIFGLYATAFATLIGAVGKAYHWF